MNRGTTPTIRFNMPLENPDVIWFTFSQNGAVKINIENDRMTLENGKYKFVLTQAETLSLDSNLLVDIQVRAKKDSVAIASNIITKDVGAILKGGEI